MNWIRSKKRVVIFALCAALIMLIIPSAVYAQVSTTDVAMGDALLESERTDVVTLREENIKHFALGNGIYQAIAYSHPIHELDDYGIWRDIDFSLKLTENRSNRMYTSDVFGVAFAEKYIEDMPLMTLDDEVGCITMTLISPNDGVKTQNNGHSEIVADVKNPNNSFQTIEDAKIADFSSKIIYEEVLPGVDLEYVVDPVAIKENIIVNEKSDVYKYIFELRPEGLRPVVQNDGSILVYGEKDGDIRYEMPAPFMYDALGNVSERVRYHLEEADNSYVLTILADSEWINTKGRAFPITIDPSYVRSTETADDTYIDSDSPDTGHGSNSMLWVRANRITYVKTPTPSIPDYAEVNWAALTMFYYYFDYVATGGVDVSAHKVVGNWNENTLTWNSVANAPNFGLESDALDIVSTLVSGATVNNPKQADFFITDAFKEWINNPNRNFGIGLKYVPGSQNLSVVFKSFEAGTAYRPRITYQYTMVPPYSTTVNSVFDNGYSVFYGETNEVSVYKIRGYLGAVKNRYMELLGLNLNISNASYYESPIDACKGVVTSANIDEICTCGGAHTDRDNILSHFRNVFPGSGTTTTVYWTGHRVVSDDGDENRSCSSGRNVFIFERNIEKRETVSASVLMHELNHQYGAYDHYHELTDPSDETSCKFKENCSDCGINPRPWTCIMNNGRRAITADSIICSECIEDMKAYLED